VTARARSCLALLVAALIAAPAMAKTGTPTRIDNIWHWRHHEPFAPQVREAERRAHAGPAPGQRYEGTAEVEGLYRHLMRRSPY
jgi:hypothetical protein